MCLILKKIEYCFNRFLGVWWAAFDFRSLYCLPIEDIHCFLFTLPGSLPGRGGRSLAICHVDTRQGSIYSTVARSVDVLMFSLDEPVVKQVTTVSQNWLRFTWSSWFHGCSTSATTNPCPGLVWQQDRQAEDSWTLWSNCWCISNVEQKPCTLTGYIMAISSPIISLQGFVGGRAWWSLLGRAGRSLLFWTGLKGDRIVGVWWQKSSQPIMTDCLGGSESST